MLNRQVILYISNSYQKVLLSIDTGFFTASYADKVTLISPLAYMFNRLTDKGNSLNERTVIKLIEQILPLAKLNDTSFYC